MFLSDVELVGKVGSTYPATLDGCEDCLLRRVEDQGSKGKSGGDFAVGFKKTAISDVAVSFWGHWPPLQARQTRDPFIPACLIQSGACRHRCFEQLSFTQLV